VQVNANVNAQTQIGQHVYITGNAAALGNWTIGIPLDPSAYPVWKNSVNMTSSSAVQYKYYRKNADGSVSWECYPGNGNCNGNRVLDTPSSGTVTLNDIVQWQ
jgi:glucoamylase